MYIAKSGLQVVMIPIQKIPVIGFLVLMFSLDASADMEAVTKDGRNVILKDNKTWEYIQPNEGDPSKSAVLSVINVEDLGSLCKIGLRLQNNLGYKIKSLVPSFSVYKTGGLRFESVSKGFSSIKPTRDLYREIQFHGIGCSEIDHIQVHGADQCNMGQLDKYNNEEGECLSKIFVESSDLINIRK
jgi:hypothetical protein